MTIRMQIKKECIAALFVRAANSDPALTSRIDLQTDVTADVHRVIMKLFNRQSYFLTVTPKSDTFKAENTLLIFLLNWCFFCQ